MGSTTEFADYVFEQLSGVGDLTRRRMFGEFAVYVDGVVVGFICDDQLFVKPTEAGLVVVGDDVEYAPAYPGSKDYVLVTFLDDAPLVGEFVRATADALPPPKPKKPRRQNPSR